MQTLSIPTKKRMYSIALSPSGHNIAAACGDRKLRVWDRSTGDVRQWISIGPTSDGYDILYLDDNRLVFAGAGMYWWDIPANGWNNISPLHLWRRRLCLSRDRKHLAMADEAESIENPMALLAMRPSFRHSLSFGGKRVALPFSDDGAIPHDGIEAVRKAATEQLFQVRWHVVAGNRNVIGLGPNHRLSGLGDGDCIAGSVGHFREA
jgi:hypothetical protein